MKKRTTESGQIGVFLPEQCLPLPLGDVLGQAGSCCDPARLFLCTSKQLQLINRTGGVRSQWTSRPSLSSYVIIVGDAVQSWPHFGSQMPVGQPEKAILISADGTEVNRDPQ